jgi:hypothetical protein
MTAIHVAALPRKVALDYRSTVGWVEFLRNPSPPLMGFAQPAEMGIDALVCSTHPPLIGLIEPIQ